MLCALNILAFLQASTAFQPNAEKFKSLLTRPYIVDVWFFLGGFERNSKIRLDRGDPEGISNSTSSLGTCDFICLVHFSELAKLKFCRSPKPVLILPYGPMFSLATCSANIYI